MTVEEKLAKAIDALKQIEAAPAWGYPDKWETTPAEVRWLARDVLKEIVSDNKEL